MLQARNRSNSIKLQPTEDGLHIKDTILWLDSYLCGQISFISVASDQRKGISPQVISTEETSKILETFHKKTRALVCQYNRPFSIGRLRMELLPSGYALGAASLYLEANDKSLLYAPYIHTQKSSTSRTTQLKKAQTLILGAHQPLMNFPNRKKEMERLIGLTEAAVKQNKHPIIMCQAVGIAQEITHLLAESNLPVAAHRTIYKVNKIYEDYGGQLGTYGLYSTKRSRQKVTLLPSLIAAKSGKISLSPDRPVFVVNHNGLQSPLALNKPTEEFNIKTNTEVSELSNVIERVKPSELFFYGPFAKQYADRFKASFPTVQALYPNDQPTLF